MNYFNYFTEIEDTFIRRRGRHLLLSPMDWALIESWKEMGVPLHVALRGVEKAFDSYESKPRKRTVKTLLYCQEEVEAQFAEWRERQTGAHGETEGAGGDGSAQEAGVGLPFPREAILAHLAASREALTRAADARRAEVGVDELCETLARAGARLAELERDFVGAVRPDAEQLEASLCDLESLLDRVLRASIAPERIEARRAEAAAQLKAYRARMEHAVYEQTLDHLVAKSLREECGVPRLSLFYL